MATCMKARPMAKGSVVAGKIQDRKEEVDPVERQSLTPLAKASAEAVARRKEWLAVNVGRL